MNLNPDIDLYARWLPLVGTDEIREAHLPEHFTGRLTRLKAIYDYYRQFPNKQTAELVAWEEQMFGTKKTQAYQDLQLVRLLLGNIEASTKEFWRWRINTIIEENIKSARRAGDYKAVASLVKNLIANNKTDKDDPLELDFDRIVPQTFELTDDITIINPAAQRTPREKIRQLLRKYGSSELKVHETDFQEIQE